MKLLVAGASGFIGRNLLLKTPSSWKITALYNTKKDFPAFLSANHLSHVQPVQCDLRDTAETQTKFKDNTHFDACVFVLGNSDIGLSSRDPLFDLSANVHTLLNLITNTYIKKFIFMSSGTVYLGHNDLVSPSTPVEPLVPYGISKLTSETYIKFFKEKTDRIKEYVILRFFGAYGPYELPRKIYTNLIKNFSLEEKSDYKIAGGGKNLIDAMYIDDTVEGLLKIIESQKSNVTVDFCKGEPLTINDLVESVGKILGVKNVNIHHEGQSSEYITFRASPNKMEELFGFRAKTSLKDGILKFEQFLRKNHAKA